MFSFCFFNIKSLSWVFAFAGPCPHTHVNVVTGLICGGCSVYFLVRAKLVLTSKSSCPTFCLSHGHGVWYCEAVILALRSAKNVFTQYKKIQYTPQLCDNPQQEVFSDQYTIHYSCLIYSVIWVTFEGIAIFIVGQEYRKCNSYCSYMILFSFVFSSTFTWP